MAKKSKKLESMNQTHAKVETTELTSLDQVWGFNDLARYGTMDESEYKMQLTNMTRADLENHARSLGCIVVEDSVRLRDSMLKQFRSYVLSLRKPVAPKHEKIKITADVQKILNEGR